MSERMTRGQIIENIKALEVEDFQEFDYVESGPCVDTGELLAALGLDCEDEWTTFESVRRLLKMLERPAEGSGLEP